MPLTLAPDVMLIHEALQAALHPHPLFASFIEASHQHKTRPGDTRPAEAGIA